MWIHLSLIGHTKMCIDAFGIECSLGKAQVLVMLPMRISGCRLFVYWRVSVGINGTGMRL